MHDKTLPSVIGLSWLFSLLVFTIGFLGFLYNRFMRRLFLAFQSTCHSFHKAIYTFPGLARYCHAHTAFALMLVSGLAY